MANPRNSNLIIDAIHGDIHLTPLERRIIDTASFQRLRYLKQLGMAHLVYSSATHTRFAHSVGVLGLMERISKEAKEPLKLSSDDVQDVRLAGLLHDIGHYPYSHLMESVDDVQLSEDFVEDPKPLGLRKARYPDHAELGELIVTSQPDLVAAIGGIEQARRIAELFSGWPEGKEQLSKLVHSSLDMDRMDYLLRDAHATGLPYGHFDINYLLNMLRVSPTGMLGVDMKALPAAEHFLFARFFMHKTVYTHKTIYGMEEMVRQLLRRLRDIGDSGVPADGDAIRKLVSSEHLKTFTDSYVDKFVHAATNHEDPVIKALARAVQNRTPPKLLKRVPVLEPRNTKHHAGISFKKDCRIHLDTLAKEFGIPLGRFLVCETKKIKLEERGRWMDDAQARDLKPEEKEALIKVFVDGKEEPTSIVNIDHSLVSVCAGYFYQAFRLYVVPGAGLDADTVEKLKTRVQGWGNT